MAENEEEQNSTPEAPSSSESETRSRKAGKKEPTAADGADEHLDEQAASVAEALGVTDQEDGDEDVAKAPRNRATRRRQRALARRAGRPVPSEDEDELQSTEKDRNRRKRQDLLRRRQQAAAADEEDAEGAGKLLPSEMVDDALARGGAATVKWVRRNWSVLQWIIIAGVVGGSGALYWTYQTDTEQQESSDALARAVADERATVIPEKEDKRTDEDKKFDPRVVFASNEAREESALKEFRAVSKNYPDKGPGILAKLGEAGVLFEQAEWDKAIAAFDEVLGSPLAPADVDVKGRALEGKAFAQEAKGDTEKALATLVELKTLSAEGFKFSADFHTARLLLAKGETEKGTALLKETRSAVEKANISGTALDGAKPYRWLEKAIEDTLRRVDPTALPPKQSEGQSAEAIRQMLQKQGIDPNMLGK